MAAGGAHEADKGPSSYNGGLTFYVVLSCVVAAMGGLIFGFDVSISGGVTSMDSFLSEFFPDILEKQRDAKTSNYCRFNSQLLTTFTAYIYLAGLVSSLLASWATSKLGRRSSMLIGGVGFLAGAILCAAAVNLYMLILGRLFLGVGIGFTNQAIPVYLSEMAPSRLRGAISNGFQLCVAVGSLCASLLNLGVVSIKVGWGWRISLSVAALPAALFTAGTFFLPDTPGSLLQRGTDPQTVKLLLQKIRGSDDVDEEMDDLAAAADLRTPSPSLGVIFSRPHRHLLIMAVAIPFFQQMTGINMLTFYGPVFFRTTGLGERAALLSKVIAAVAGVASTMVSVILVDRVGRRMLFITGGVVMLVMQLVIGGILKAGLHDQGSIGRGSSVLVLVLVCAYIAAFSWSWGPLGWAVPGEIFPLEVRSAGQSIVVVVNFFFTFLVIQTFLAMLCGFKAGIFFFYGGWILVMTFAVYYLLPETKNVPLERMGIVWRQHWFWKKML